MKTQNILFGLICLFICNLNPLLAQEPQDSTVLWRIETKDHNEYLGKIISMDENEIILHTEALGIIRIPKRNVITMHRVEAEKMIEGEYWSENHQATRYFWAPNGYGLKKGEGYYQNVWVFFNQASAGISNNFSMGIGMIPLFLFNGTPTPVWITPKFSFPVIQDKFNLGGGALIGTVLGETDASFGIAYGVSTFGSRNRNVNIGLGYGFINGEWADAPMISFSAMARTGRKGYFITENYFLKIDQENTLLISLGGRTVWEKVSLDYGLVVPFTSNMGGFIAIPWLGLSVPLGNKHIQR